MQFSLRWCVKSLMILFIIVTLPWHTGQILIKLCSITPKDQSLGIYCVVIPDPGMQIHYLTLQENLSWNILNGCLSKDQEFTDILTVWELLSTYINPLIVGMGDNHGFFKNF